MHKCSYMSLYIEMFFNEKRLSRGTAFLTKANNKIYLITNRHNVTGRDQHTKQPLHPSCGVPNEIKIFHHSVKDGEWIPKVKPLYSENEDPLWIEHPKYKEKADFVALEIVDLSKLKESDIKFIFFDLTKKIGLQINPSDSISIIGFPFGESAGEQKEQYYPIWLNGFVASEMSIDYNGLPVFLIDARTRGGNSGSPVWGVRNKTVFLHNGIPAYYDDVAEFLGVYSGRINEESDIGYVWKASAILELVNYIKEITK